MVIGAVLLGALVTGDASAADDAATRLHQRVRSAVPSTWWVRASGSTIVASRDVVVLEEADPPAAGEPPGTRRYEIVLTIGSRMTQAELDDLRAKNQRVRRQLARLERRMTSFACDPLEQAYRDHCYRPRTRAQRALLEKHDKLRAALRVLPAYHVDDLVSVTLRVDAARWYERIDCDDCARVEAAIVALLEPYSGSPDP
jgi:hypothetical protein